MGHAPREAGVRQVHGSFRRLNDAANEPSSTGGGLSQVATRYPENRGLLAMTLDRGTYYPFDLARIVAEQLHGTCGRTPPTSLLVRLFETLYFTSLATEEGRLPLCTVNFVEREAPEGGLPPQTKANHWTAVPFHRPLPLDVRSLTKLARAADPDVSSLNVFADDAGDLFVWGMVDQEPRHGDQIVLQAVAESRRPGLFQATITGAGSISVYQHGALWANLSRHVLVETHHDVLWSGPVHTLLAEHLRSHLAERYPRLTADCGSYAAARVEHELLLRWLNALSRLLVNVQHYRHGGGLIIVPRPAFHHAKVKYRIDYDRLTAAVVALVRAYLLRHRAIADLMEAVKSERPGNGNLPDAISYILDVHNEVEARKGEVLGCVRFIASLSCVDGVVLLDSNLGVHGFGAELRPDVNLEDVFMAGDVNGSPAQLRPVDITHFGTRHRAMMRYCHQVPESLGLAVSQDGDIQALMRIDDKLVVWENIDVALALNAAEWTPENVSRSLVLRRLSVRVDK